MNRKGKGIVVVLVIAAFVVTCVRILAAIDKDISNLWKPAWPSAARRQSNSVLCSALLPRNFFVHTFSRSLFRHV